MSAPVAQEIEWYFEDFRAGDVYKTMKRTLTEFDIMSFVTLGGFYEEIWINATKPRAETLGSERLVPGPLTWILAEGLYVLTGRMHHAMAFLSLTDLKWTAPVTCGDTIQHVIEIEAVRRSRTKDGGIVTSFHRVINQDGVEVMSYRTARMNRAREPRPDADDAGEQ